MRACEGFPELHEGGPEAPRCSSSSRPRRDRSARGAQRLRSKSSEEGDCGLSFPGRCAPGPQDGYACRPTGLAMPLRHCAPLRGLPMPNSGIGSFSLVPRSARTPVGGPLPSTTLRGPPLQSSRGRAKPDQESSLARPVGRSEGHLLFHSIHAPVGRPILRPPSPELLGGASRPPPVVLQGASRPPSCIGWWRAPARPPGVTRPQAESVVSFPARLRLAHLTTPGVEGVARHEMAIHTAQEDIGLFCWSACRPPQNSSPVGLPASPSC